MVMLVGMGHAKIQADLVQKIGFGQGHAATPEVAGHVKHQAVGADLETVVVIQQATRIATIGIQGKAFNQGGLLALGRVEGHLHAGRWCAVHGVQHMCTQAHGKLLVAGSMKWMQSVYTFGACRYHSGMDTSATSFIVDSLTRAIVEHRLQPGAKLVEQKLADQFGVSRTLVRQALYRLSQNRLIKIEPARGAFVASPTADEARQVFEVRRMLEAGMVRSFVQHAKASDIKTLQTHMAQEKLAVQEGDVPGRTELLGDFHVCMAQLMHNDVLAQLLSDLISRSALITLMYQSSTAAAHSHEEHEAIVRAIKARDANAAAVLLDAHLCHVEDALNLSQYHSVTP